MDIFWLYTNKSSSSLQERTWFDSYREHLSANPEAPAVKHQLGTLSYRQLELWSNWVSQTLSQYDLGEGFVGICLDRTPQLIAALLGIQKGGAGYLPLDPLFPENRIQYMIEASGIQCIVTEAKYKSLFEHTGVTLVVLEGEYHEAPDFEYEVIPSARAYVLYTSGSTGLPKGVVIPHRGFNNFLQSMKTSLDMSPGQGTLALTTISFDISGLEIFLPLYTGGFMYLATKEEALRPDLLTGLLTEGGLTLLQGTPTTWQMVFTEGHIPLEGKKILCGGEAMSETLGATLLNTGAEVWNMYGPTETTIWSSMHKLRKGDKGAPPIGNPIANTGLHILGENLEPLSPGEEGELYISGMGLAEGYWKDPERTSERFLTHPEYGIRLYKTGDLVSADREGGIYFKGRVDNQLKIRGFRIEAGEIEKHLMAIEEVENAVVLGQQDRLDNTILVAYLLTRNQEPLDHRVLRKALEKNLPEYMIPTQFVPLEEFPRTPNNKIDRKAFPSLRHSFSEAKSQTRNRNSSEEILTNIWRDILNRQDFTRDDNFFDIGGYSLLLLQVRNRINGELGWDISMMDLFEHPTINSLLNWAPQKEAVSVIPQEKDSPSPEFEDDEYSLAVIGMSCVVPGAEDTQAFWDLLAGGRSGIHQFTDTELMAAGIPEDEFTKEDYIPRSGALFSAQYFDHEFFGYSPQEARFMDPQHRVFLEQSYRALESACITPEKYSGRIGVFAGAGQNQYLLKNILFSSDKKNWSDFQTMIGNNNDFLATRVAYKLGLTGPAVTVQTACSTSLVAINMAYQSLMSYQSDVVLAGGVSLTLPLVQGYQHMPGSIFSPDGYCRAFDKEASGTVFGSGAGVVVLKRYQDAKVDGDPILGKIRGIAVNNDGSDKMGYTAPSINGQSQVIAAALEAANVHPEEVSYLEAHGTGTKLGDPIEVAALTKAFRQQTQKQGYCGIGSVKTNIGHLDAAAGVISLIKVLLAMEHKKIPPTLNYNTPNPEMKIETTPFRVIEKLEDWNSPSPRIAGVSSFGIGGTNAHIIVEEPDSRVTTPAQKPVLIPVWAKSEASALAISQFSGEQKRYQGDSEDILFSQLSEAPRYPYRGYFVSGAKKAIYSRQVRNNKGRDPLVFMFPGQGTHYPGMVIDLYNRFLPFKEALDSCFSVLKKLVDWDPWQVLTQDEKALNCTSYIQPVLFSIEYSLAQYLISLCGPPQFLIGHSLGELTAAAVGGAYTLEEMMFILVERGRFMEEAPEGKMVAVMTSIENIETCLNPQLSVSAYNNQEQVVIAGTSERIHQFISLIEEKGFPYRLLSSNKAFHSPHMKTPAQNFQKAISHINARPLSIPLLSNLTGELKTRGYSLEPEYWSRHMVEPVQFYQSIKSSSLGAQSFIFEVGPGRVLSQLVKVILPDHNKPVPLIPGEGDKRFTQEVFLGGLGEFFTQGGNLEWQGLHPLRSGRRVSRPLYHFQRIKHWIEPDLSPEHTTPGETKEESFTLYDEGYSTQEKIKEIWSDLLGIKELSQEDNFFDLGGDSLLAVELISRVNTLSEQKISLDQFFRKPTIKYLAVLVKEKNKQQMEQVFQLNKSSESKVIYFLVGVQIYQELATALSDYAKCYAVYIPEEEGVLSGDFNAANWDAVKMAQTYKEIIDEHREGDDFSIVGMSFGGIVAYEVSRLFALEGVSVELTVMLDSLLPSARKRNYRRWIPYKIKELVLSRGDLVWKKITRQSNSGTQNRIEAILARRGEIYLAAAKRFDKGPRQSMAQPVLLIKAAEECKIPGYVFTEDYNWGDRCDGPFFVEENEGKHLDLLKSPYVEQTGKIIKNKIEKLLSAKDEILI